MKRKKVYFILLLILILIFIQSSSSSSSSLDHHSSASSDWSSFPSWENVKLVERTQKVLVPEYFPPSRNSLNNFKDVPNLKKKKKNQRNRRRRNNNKKKVQEPKWFIDMKKEMNDGNVNHSGVNRRGPWKGRKKERKKGEKADPVSYYKLIKIH